MWNPTESAWSRQKGKWDGPATLLSLSPSLLLLSLLYPAAATAGAPVSVEAGKECTTEAK